MNTFPDPSKHFRKIIKRTAQEWLRLSLFMSEEEAKQLEQNPPPALPDEMRLHDVPLRFDLNSLVSG